MLVYELSGSGFKRSCSHLNFTLRACFEQGIPWHSSNYLLWIHPETCLWHDRPYSQLRRTDKYSEHTSFIWSFWPNGWVFVYELKSSWFESRFCHLNFTLRAYFEQGVSWHLGNYTQQTLALMKTSSRRVDQDEYIHITHTSSKRLQDVLQKRLQDALQRCLQDLLKMHHWVNLILLTRLQDVFNTFSRRFQNVFKT